MIVVTKCDLLISVLITFNYLSRPGAKKVASLNIGLSNLLLTLTSSSLMLIPCGQWASHLPHFLQSDAMDFSFFIAVHMKYSLQAFE